MIDARDDQERVFAASLQGVDLTSNTLKPGRTSSQTTVGLDAFMRSNWDQGAKIGEVIL